uniref:Uncharacterized protein n=1 Tax=Oryza brachyantha TaxID=4533 RepID=J3LSC7_ORYBR
MVHRIPIYSCCVYMIPLHNGQHQLTRVIMYQPFSKSYMIFVLSFLRLANQSDPPKRNTPNSTASNDLLLRADLPVPGDFRFCLLCLK